MPSFSNPACKTAYTGKKLSYPVIKHNWQNQEENKR
jgi:hypothetical protein